VSGSARGVGAGDPGGITVAVRVMCYDTPMSTPDARLVDFASARVNRIADAIGGRADLIKLTNHHLERLNREVGELRRKVGGLGDGIAPLRSEMRTGFDRIVYGCTNFAAK
jgi:hypothetical protein